MSKGKHTASRAKKSRPRRILPLLVIAAVAAAAVAAVLVLRGGGSEPQPPAGTDAPSTPTDITALPTGQPSTATDLEPGGAAPIAVLDGTEIYPGLVIEHAGRYAGMFVEDGTDELVADVFALTLTNTSNKMLEYARFTITCGEVYTFEVSSIPAGESVQALELQRSTAPDDFADAVAAADMVSFFDSPVSVYPEVFEITGQVNGITVKNISDKTASSVFVYYKNVFNGVYVGGITYRASIGELAPGSEFTAYAGHYMPENCEILFVTYS